MKSNLIFATFLILSVFHISCKSHNKTTSADNTVQQPGPRTYIYQTTADYYLQVPVTLSDDKKELHSYPSPGDVYYKGELALPVQLENGFLLDRRGIHPQSAFTKWTYAEYSRLKQTPTQDEIMDMLLDTDPFVSLYDCGPLNKYSNPIEELNAFILANDFSSFRKLK
ncbi:MAG: hypothetical protein RBR28_11125 [Lentimicrobium sp.]|jgi:hypothetical protein|nr:hypothetical protein [Lentimicrobium sp.]